MKTTNLLAIVLVYILVNNKASIGQINPAETNQIIFKDQKALELQMSKYGLKTLEFPEGDYCERTGPPTAKVGDKMLPNLPYICEPEVKYPGDTMPGGWAEVDKDINIFWIHGLNGNTNSLRIPAITTQFGSDSFPARKVNSIRGVASSNSHPVQLYSEESNITDATGDINNYSKTVLDASKRTPRDYIIAHSQGGIVAREWLRNMDQKPNMYENFAHGLVTFGTPHWGAEVLNNTRHELGDKVPAFVNEACESLTSPFIETAIKNTFITRMIITPSLKDKIKTKVCDALSETIVPFALSNYFKETTRDYYVGSPFLTGKTDNNGNHVQGLSEYALKVPVVQFYGEEEQPILWKFLSSTRGMGHDEMDAYEIKYGYGQDNQMELEVSDKLAEYHAKREDAKKEVKRLENALYHRFMSGFSFKTNKLRDAEILVKAYDKAFVWLSNANDYYLSELIGGRKTISRLSSCLVIESLLCKDTTSIGTAYPWVNLNLSYTVGSDLSGKECDVTPIGIKYRNYSFKGLNGKTWHGKCFGSQSVIQTWKVEATYIANDGVVLSESAAKKILVDKSSDPKITHRVGLMVKTNHDQMKNCLETKKALLDLYNGEKYGSFFKVKVR